MAKIIDDNPTKWIMIDYQASSLFNFIKNGNFTSTIAGIKAWESLVVHKSLIVLGGKSTS
jgi:hypothetical protein